MKRPLSITTAAEYKAAYPDETRAVVLVVVNPATGEAAVRYYQGNDDRHFIANDVVSFVYINQWHVQIFEGAVG